MKKINKTQILGWLLAFGPLVLTLIMYRRLPEQIPTQWGLAGEVAYGPKSTLWYMSALSPVMAVLFTFLPRIDPRKRSYEKFRGFYDAFCLVMMLFLFAMTAMIVSESLHPGRLSVSVLVTAACGLLFAFLGNMLPKVKSNFFVGIRTPWALSNSEVWNKTNRLGGYLFFYGGILLVVLSFLLRDTALFAAMMVITMTAALVPAVMSYVWYRRLPPE